MYEGEHKISVVSDLLWCVEVVGGDFENSLKIVRINGSRDFPYEALKTKTACLRVAKLCVAGKSSRQTT